MTSKIDWREDEGLAAGFTVATLGLCWLPTLITGGLQALRKAERKAHEKPFDPKDCELF